MLFQAGFKENQVKLALEPEAAAMWCKNIQTHIHGNVNRIGTQFMVVDLGGTYVSLSLSLTHSLTPSLVLSLRCFYANKLCMFWPMNYYQSNSRLVLQINYLYRINNWKLNGKTRK